MFALTYLIYNGDFHFSNEAIISLNNRSFRYSDGTINDANNQPNYIIQNFSLQSFSFYNEQRFQIALFEPSRKITDAFSPIKTNNYLPFVMAALWSKKNKFDDVLILTSYDRIAEATKSNVFLIKNGTLKTPALSEGCFAGVTRQYLLHSFAKENITCEEGKITTDEIMTAYEILLTNSGWYK